MQWLRELVAWRRGLADVKRKLELAKQRLEALETMPLSEAEACAVQLRYVDACEQFFQSNLVEHAKKIFDSDPWTEAKSAEQSNSQFSIVSHQHGSTLHCDPRLVVGAIAPHVRDAIKRAHAAHGHCWSKDCGPPLEERRTEMAKLEKEIASLSAELAEAREIAHREGLRL